MLLLTVLLACQREPDTTTVTHTLSCGDGILDEGEACDDGAANSDADADACRTSCRLPACGDGVADSDEDCDDGNAWSGDGCVSCAAEDGALEAEPNDTWDAAQDLGDAEVTASLPSGDIDCFSVRAGACQSIVAAVGGGCAVPVQLSLHDPSGAQVAASALVGGCAVLDPVEEPGARFAAAGDWAVCATGLLGAEVPAYTFSAGAVDSTTLGLAVPTDPDLDSDTLPDVCDRDRDGDGVDNDEDTCPDLPNGPDSSGPILDATGFIRHWLAAGPYTGEPSPEGCLPSDNERTGDDAAAAPAAGDAADGATWRALLTGDEVELTEDFGGVSAPREVYLATYLYSDAAQAVTLALGPDDGARAWLNGDVVLEVSGCQGTTADQFTGPATLQAGWNRLLVKVFDQGGGWGTYVRFLGGDGAPVSGLEVSLSPDGAWDLDQTDSDGDGVGDACDDD